MNAIGAVAALVAVGVTLAATVAVYPAVWRACRDQWRPIPPESRLRVWGGGGLAVLASAVIGVLLILQPFGPHTVVWVCLVGGGAFLVLVLVCVAAQAMLDTRRARAHRSQKQ